MLSRERKRWDSLHSPDIAANFALACLSPSGGNPGGAPCQPQAKITKRPPNWTCCALVIALIALVVVSANKAVNQVNAALNPASVAPSTQSSTAPTDNAPSTPSGPATLSIGQPAAITNATDGSPWATVTADSASPSRTPLTEFASAPQNGWFISFKITALAADGISSSFDINPLDFYVLESGGAHYDAMSGNALENNPAPALNATTLASGENVSGNVTFDVPATHGELVYAPNINGAPIAEWSF